MAEAAEAAPETDHPAPDAAAASAARTLVSGAINAAKASALEDEDLAASLRICTLDGVATTDDDADGLLAKLAALSVSAALFVTVDGEESRIDSEEALFAALRAAASSRAIAFRTESRPAKRRRDDSDDDATPAPAAQPAAAAGRGKRPRPRRH